MPARFLYHVLKSAGQPLPPRVYLLKKCVALPLVIRRPMLQSVGMHACLVIKRPVLQSAGTHVKLLEDLCCKVRALVKFLFVCLLVLQSASISQCKGATYFCR